MVCKVCNTQMNESTTEKDYEVKGRTVKVVHVPANICPSCNNVVVELVVDKIAKSIAKKCKEDTCDLDEIKHHGIGFGMKHIWPE